MTKAERKARKRDKKERLRRAHPDRTIQSLKARGLARARVGFAPAGLTFHRSCAVTSRDR